MPDVQSKIVVVTAGNRGIGEATVDRFLACGARVFATYRESSTNRDAFLAQDAVKSGQLVAIPFDAERPGDCDTLVERITKETSSVDVLVNNVGGVVRRSSLLDSDDDLWRRTFDLNVTSAIRCSRSLQPLLREAPTPVIVHVSSIAARTGGAGDSMHYGAAKAALVAVTKGLATEWAAHGIRSVCIAPSAVDTDFQRQHSSPERLAKIINQTPAKRMGEPREIAAIIQFLASEAAAYINGETIFVTGGR